MRHGWLCWARGAALLTELQLVLKLCVGRVREQFAARCHLRTIIKEAQRRCLLCLLEEAVASAFMPLDSSGIGARQVGSCVISSISGFGQGTRRKISIEVARIKIEGADDKSRASRVIEARGPHSSHRGEARPGLTPSPFDGPSRQLCAV